MGADLPEGEIQVSKHHTYLVGIALTILITGTQSAQPRSELQAETVRAFDAYVASFEAAFRKEASNGEPPAWIPSEEALLKARQGELIVGHGAEAPEIPDGLIHDWLGAVYIRGVKLEDVARVLLDYDHHSQVYSDVLESRLLSKKGDTYRSYLRFRKKKIITVILDTEHEMQIIPFSDKRLYLQSRSSRIAEVRNVGSPDETVLPEGDDSGFLWRLNAYWYLEQGPDGVLAACDSISLSRAIPFGLGPIIGPFLDSVPREALEELLDGTRREVLRCSSAAGK